MVLLPHFHVRNDSAIVYRIMCINTDGPYHKGGMLHPSMCTLIEKGTIYILH